MIALPILFAPLALLAEAAVLPGAEAPVEAALRVILDEVRAELRPDRERRMQQVRIQQRVVVRVSPRRTQSSETVRQELRNERPIRVSLQPMGSCLALGDVAAVQVSREPSRLLLYMRDRGIVAATLEKACRARSFYSGFYVEKQDDGQLCVARDTLRSRSGASCEVTALHRLVVARD